jgi:predicted MPP superfamily phosphohydrolase
MVSITMGELHALHFTDVHDHYDKLRIIRDFLRKHGDIDAVFFTGDYIEANPHPYGQQGGTGDQVRRACIDIVVTPELKETLTDINNKLQQFAHEHATDGTIIIENLGEEERKTLDQLFEEQQKVMNSTVDEHEQQLNEKLPAIVHASYQRIADIFKEIAECAPVYAVMGNHDVTIGYEHLDQHVTFLEQQRKAIVKGRNGTEFTLKGDINNWECPAFYTNIAVERAFHSYFIPYLSGESWHTIEEKIRTTKGEENRQLREHEVEIYKWQEKERQRLGSPDDVDIYLTHKLPHNDRVHKVNGDVSGDIACQYSIDAKAVHGGHFHNGQVSWSSLTDIIDKFDNDDDLERVTINGETVPVIYLERAEPWLLNPGTNYFFVTEYDADKQVEQVLVYEYVYN